MKMTRNIVAAFALGAVLFAGSGAIGAYFPSAVGIPVAVQVYRATAGVTSALMLGYIDPYWLGADGGGVNDTAPALNAAFVAASPSTPVHLSCGTYLVNSTINATPTPNGAVPDVIGAGANCVNIKAGPSLGANPILSHAGGSPYPPVQWREFTITGTGAANGQYGVKAVNTTFINYDHMNFVALAAGVHVENSGAGFPEAETISNSWATNTEYFLELLCTNNTAGCSFRGDGFVGPSTNNWINLTDVAGSRLIHIAAPVYSANLYDAPLHASVWANASSIVTQNDGTTPMRMIGELTYESGVSGWALGSGSVADTFSGVITGISFYPAAGTWIVSGVSDGIIQPIVGAFTPTLSADSSAPAVTYSVAGQQGRYTYINNEVFFSLFINVASFTGGSGYIQIGGLPFTSYTWYGGVSVDIASVQANSLTFVGNLSAEIDNNANTLHLLVITSAANSARLPLSACPSSTGCTIWVSGHYTAPLAL